MTRSNAFPLEPAWRPLLKDLGVRPADVLRRARLPEDLFSRAEVSLSTQEYFRFWDSLEAEIGDALFPLRVVEMVTTESFLPPLFAALCSPNLTVAAERIAQYKRLIAPMALIVAMKRDALALTFKWLDAAAPPPKSLVAAELAFIVRLARIATREEIRPLKVVTANPPEPASAYRRFFGAIVERGKEHALVFAKADAERPFLTASESMWKTFEPELRKRLAELDASATTRERVRASLLELLPSGQASMPAVAHRLAISTRTLQRRLGAENTSFQEILKRTREHLARHYLSKTALAASEIAFLLGFEDSNSFFRAFQDWTGNTPDRVRQAAKQAGSVATEKAS